MMFEIGQVNRLGNRQSNQDRFTVLEHGEDLLAILADGMGGRARGEVAAEMVVEAAQRILGATHENVENIPLLVKSIAQKAHQRIVHYASTHKLDFYPGTTGVFCYFKGNQMTVAHIGDSRCYHFRKGKTHFRTNDHSFIQEMVDSGTLTHAEAKQHPKRHQITRCIGCRIQPPELEIAKPVQLEVGDVVLLCSDGLWAALSEQQIVQLLEKHEIEQVVEMLAEKAEKQSYPLSDNISVIAIRYCGEEKHSTEEVDKQELQQAPANKVDNAINHIQQMIKQYEDEIEESK
jgi:serine/threonine protein phosphatase PrpC